MQSLVFFPNYFEGYVIVMSLKKTILHHPVIMIQVVWYNLVLYLSKKKREKKKKIKKEEL